MGLKINVFVYLKLLFIVNLYYKIVRDIIVIISCICIYNFFWVLNDIFLVKKKILIYKCMLIDMYM